MAAGEEAAAAARADFARHWQEEFPGEPAPRMELGSVRAMERELERCRRHLRRLQRALAEERFKVLYLEAALARAPPRPPALPRRRPPPAAPCGSSPEGGSDGSSGAEDASSAGGWRGDTALRVGARQRGWRPPVRQRGPAAPQPPCQLLTGLSPSARSGVSRAVPPGYLHVPHPRTSCLCPPTLCRPLCRPCTWSCPPCHGTAADPTVSPGCPHHTTGSTAWPCASLNFTQGPVLSCSQGHPVPRPHPWADPMWPLLGEVAPAQQPPPGLGCCTKATASRCASAQGCEVLQPLRQTCEVSGHPEDTLFCKLLHASWH